MLQKTAMYCNCISCVPFYDGDWVISSLKVMISTQRIWLLILINTSEVYRCLNFLFRHCLSFIIILVLIYGLPLALAGGDAYFDDDNDDNDVQNELSSHSFCS